MHAAARHFAVHPIASPNLKVASLPTLQAGITFFGSAGVGHGSSQPASAMVHHALEPSPLGAAPLSPSRQAGAAATAAACQPLAGIPLSFASPLQPAPEAASAGTEAVQFAAGEAAATAQRAAVKERPGRTAACGIPRNGSHPHLNHLARRSIGVPGSAEALSAEGQEQLLRRKERFDAAAMAAQEHREEKLAALRTQRAASSEDAEVRARALPSPCLPAHLHPLPQSGACFAASYAALPVCRCLPVITPSLCSLACLPTCLTLPASLSTPPAFLPPHVTCPPTPPACLQDVLEMIDVPENMQRLSSFLGNRGGSGRGSSARELAAAGAVADLENETRSLLKHMSIGEWGWLDNCSLLACSEQDKSSCNCRRSGCCKQAGKQAQRCSHTLFRAFQVRACAATPCTHPYCSSVLPVLPALQMRLMPWLL
jgi:hypothetical protein